MTIHALIIEDDETSIDVLQSLLEREGASTTVVFSSAAILDDIAAAAIPDVIFLDLEMPGINGYEVLDYIRSSADLGGVPVVAYTTHTSHMTIARDAGFDAFLGKPLNRRDFGEHLQRILDGEDVWEVP